MPFADAICDFADISTRNVIWLTSADAAFVRRRSTFHKRQPFRPPLRAPRLRTESARRRQLTIPDRAY
jgi:hypothetical protein